MFPIESLGKPHPIAYPINTQFLPTSYRDFAQYVLIYLSPKQKVFGGRMKISQTFIIKLKLHSDPAYRIAQMAGVNPTTLSKLIHGAEPIRPDDDRLLRVGRILGLEPDEIFVSREVALAARGRSA